MLVQTIPRVQQPTLGAEAELACVVDVETTGLNPHRDEIVELSLILFAYSPVTGEIIGVVDEYAGQREPSVSISREATGVHGLTKRQLRGLRLDGQRIDSIIGRARLFVAHNASFDRGFCARYMVQFTHKPWYCSMRGVPWKRLGFASQGLQNLLRDHRIPAETAHRAGEDTRGLLQLLACRDDSGRPYLYQVVRSSPIADEHGSRVAAGRQSAASVRSHSTPQEKNKTSGCGTMILVVVAVILAIAVNWILGLIVLFVGLYALSGETKT